MTLHSSTLGNLDDDFLSANFIIADKIKPEDHSLLESPTVNEANTGWFDIPWFKQRRQDFRHQSLPQNVILDQH